MIGQANAFRSDRLLKWTAWVVILISGAAAAQVPAAESVVPRLSNYASVAKDADGRPLKGVVGATFAVYAAQEGGAALWMETQNIQADPHGNFSVVLGATKPEGLPADLFANGQARWLGISFNGAPEEARVALVSVPYALKAGDAQTLGGLPASAFMLATSSLLSDGTSVASASAASSPSPSAAPPLSGTGTADFVPLWLDSSGTLGNSVLFQSGSGTTAKVGINTTTPTVTLDVKGAGTIRGLLSLPSLSAATAAAGKNSQPLGLTASAFSSTTSTAVNQNFRWLAEPAGNNTTAPSGTLNLLFGTGTATPTETGFHIGSNGQITFATGQTFPGTGTITGVTTAAGSGLTGGGTSGSLGLSLTNACAANQILKWSGTAWACAGMNAGTITGVTAGTDLTGGGTSGNITLNLDTTKVPLLAATNTFVGNQNITGDLNVSNGISVTGNSFAGTSNGLAALQVTQGGTTGSGALVGISHSNLAGSGAILGTALSTSGQVFGVEGTAQNSTAAGVYGVDGKQSSTGASWVATFINGSGVWGDGGNDGFQGVLGTSDNSSALLGANNSPQDAAVYGFNLNTTQTAPGVTGGTNSPTGFGMIGQGYLASNTYLSHIGSQPFGVVGEAGDETASAGLPIGVWGAADTGYAVVGENTSSLVPAGAFLNVSDTAGNPAFVAGSDLGNCTIDTEGNMGCNGIISGQVPAAGARKVSLYAMQSPENWFEDFGGGRLSSGAATVVLDPAFAETVNSSADYHVFLTPKGDCKGLFVAEESASGFVVREMGGGRSSVAFDYRIVAKRKGFENVRMADVTERQGKLAASIRQLTKENDPKMRQQPHMPGVRTLHPNRQAAPSVAQR